jgi:hypothetical protein
MITAERLAYLTSMTPAQLTQTVQASGYKKDRVNECRFLGMTNGGQFCYEVDYDDFGTPTKCKLFVTYDPASGRVSADY